MKRIHAILLGLSTLGFIASCNKNEVKDCTYYNKPIPTQVSFVGYFDYELINVHVYHMNKQVANDTIKVDSLMFPNMPNMVQDTSQFIFAMNEKTDYIVVLPNSFDTFRIKDLNYQDIYVNEPPTEDGCKTVNLEQKATAAQVNNVRTAVVPNHQDVPVLYLVR